MQQVITVATFNVLHGLHLRSGGKIDLPALAGAVHGLGADVVALQEVDRGLARSGGVDQVDWLAGELGWSGVFAPALLGDPEDTWTVPDEEDPGGPAYGIGLLSRLPILEAVRHRLPGGGASHRARSRTPSRPGWDHEPRTALACDIDIGVGVGVGGGGGGGASAGRLPVVTAHLSYLPWRGLAQLRAMGRAAGDDPALLLGDLNLGPRLVRLALPHWDLHPAPPTHPAWSPRTRIDHVLSRGLDVRDVRVAGASTSDHLPVLADVRVG